MNKIEAIISKISNNKQLHILEFIFHDKKLKMMSLELNENIKEGTKVLLNIKPTQTSFVKSLKDDISIANKILGQITKIDKGELLSCVTCKAYDTYFESILLTSVLNEMKIEENEKILILIKASDLYIQEVLDD